MGPGLPTSAQIKAFRRRLHSESGSRSLWVSATLNRDWLATVDFRPHLAGARTLTLAPEEQTHATVRQRRESIKRLRPADARLGDEGAKGGFKGYLERLSNEVLEAHRPDGQTLVILNTVERAQAIFQSIERRFPHALLVHSRYRPADRRRINEALRAPPPAEGRVIVATQAVEAGVDITSNLLITELAPWSALVQRFGRCNRYGEAGDEGAESRWIDIATDGKLPSPYEPAALDAARAKLDGLASASPADLPPTDELAPLHPVIRRKDFIDLFNTDPDLSGFDIDISPYIRDADLVAYLIAAHHGKVRLTLRAMPGEQEPPEPEQLFARGIWANDVLPELQLPEGSTLPPCTLHLDLMQLGENAQGRSWTARTQRLLQHYGPSRLAWLESLVRIADWRASHRE